MSKQELTTKEKKTVKEGRVVKLTPDKRGQTQHSTAQHTTAQQSMGKRHTHKMRLWSAQVESMADVMT
jgi:hypothetical protein